ncbi:DNA cytosine methyltransferase, partial [Acinetobacter baumannii]
MEIVALDSADFGVPQNRRRLFILADKLKRPRLPKRTASKPFAARGILARQDDYNWTPLKSPGRAEKTLERAERAISELGQGVDF